MRAGACRAAGTSRQDGQPRRHDGATHPHASEVGGSAAGYHHQLHKAGQPPRRGATCRERDRPYLAVEAGDGVREQYHRLRRSAAAPATTVWPTATAVRDTQPDLATIGPSPHTRRWPSRLDGASQAVAARRCDPKQQRAGQQGAEDGEKFENMRGGCLDARRSLRDFSAFSPIRKRPQPTS
jgi:hypothetical protein